MNLTKTPLLKVRDIMQRDVTTVSEGDDLALAQQIMLWRRLRHLPVLRNEQIVGILSERDMLSHRLSEMSPYTLAGQVGEVMRYPVETIHPGALVADAAARMSLQKIGCLPVVDAGSLVGIITTTDVLGANAWLPIETAVTLEEPVRTVMATQILALHADDSLEDAVAFMSKRGVRHAPVIDGIKRVVGILSERDIRGVIGNPFEMPSAEARSSRVAAIKVSHAMTPDPRTIHQDARLSEALQALVVERFGALPVVDDEEVLVGMVSYLDLLGWKGLIREQTAHTHPTV